MNPLLIIGTVIWLYVLTVFKRTQLMAYFFILGSVGLFFILIALSDPYWVWLFTHMVIQGVKGFGSLTGMCTVMSKYGAVHIISGNLSSLLMTIDYECSGIIETSAFTALVVFFSSIFKEGTSLLRCFRNPLDIPCQCNSTHNRSDYCALFWVHFLFLCTYDTRKTGFLWTCNCTVL